MYASIYLIYYLIIAGLFLSIYYGVYKNNYFQNADFLVLGYETICYSILLIIMIYSGA